MAAKSRTILVSWLKKHSGGAFTAFLFLVGASMVLCATWTISESHPGRALRRLSPQRIEYHDAGSGQPQTVVLTLRNMTGFNVSNIQVIPSCGCVVDDFDVFDLKPDESQSGTLTIRNDEGDARTTLVLVQYHIQGNRVDELVEVTPAD